MLRFTLVNLQLLGVFEGYSAASPKVKVSVGVALWCSERHICLKVEGAGQKGRGLGCQTLFCLSRSWWFLLRQFWCRRVLRRKRSGCCVHAKVTAGCEAGPPWLFIYTPVRASVTHYGHHHEDITRSGASIYLPVCVGAVLVCRKHLNTIHAGIICCLTSPEYESLNCRKHCVCVCVC